MVHPSSLSTIVVDLVPRRSRKTGVGYQALAEDLVHAHGRRGGVTTNKGQVEHLEEPLDRAVFAEGAVQHREGDVERAVEEGRVETVPTLEGCCSIGAISRLGEHVARGVAICPETAAVDGHRHDVVALSVQGPVHRSCRDDADVVLTRATAEYQGDLQFAVAVFPGHAVTPMV